MSQGKLSFKDLLNPVATTPGHAVLSYAHSSNNDELEAEVMASLPRLLESNNTFTQNSNIANAAAGDSPNSALCPRAKPTHVTLPPSGTHLPPIKSVLPETGRLNSNDDIPRYTATGPSVGVMIDGGANGRMRTGEATIHQRQPPRLTTHNSNSSSGSHMLAQLAAPSRPAYYPSQPSSYYYAPLTHAQSSQRAVYPRPNPVTTNTHNISQGLGYSSRPMVSLPPRQQHPGMSPSHEDNNVRIVPGSGYQEPQYNHQARQPQHNPQAPSSQQYPSYQQASQHSSFMHPSQSHQYQYQYGQQPSVTGEYYPHLQMQRPTSSIPPIPRPYYDHHPAGSYHQHSYAHTQGSSTGGAPAYNGTNSVHHPQAHSMFPRRATDVPPRAGSPYIVPSGPLPDSSSMLRSCANCGTRETPSWRRCGPDQTILCNACGLYYNEHKRHRQFRVNADGRTRAVRSPKFKLIEGDHCPECTVRGGEVRRAGLGGCGTCQYIRQQSCTYDDLPSASSATARSNGDGGDSSDSSTAALAPPPVTASSTSDLGVVLRPAPSTGQ